MALETLKDVEQIGGFNVVIMDDLKKKFPERFSGPSSQMDYAWFEKEIRPKNFIYIRHDVNSIAFTIQNGPVKENGVNGCQVDSLIDAALKIITRLNNKLPCKENEVAMDHLARALSALEDRRLNREKRGVEGFNVA